MQLKRVRRNWWKIAVLGLIPVMLLWIIAAKRSWLPRELHIVSIPAAEQPTARIASLAWSPDNRTIVVGVNRSPQHNEVQFWDTVRKTVTRTMQTEAIRQLHINTTGNLLSGMTKGDAPQVMVWKLPQGTTLMGTTKNDLGCDDSSPLWFEDDGTLKRGCGTYDTRFTQTLLASPQHKPDDFTLHVDEEMPYDINKTQFVVAEDRVRDIIKLYYHDKGHLTFKWKVENGPHFFYNVGGISLSPNGKLFVATSYRLGDSDSAQEPLVMRRTSDGAVVWKVLSSGNEWAGSVIFSPDSRFLAEDGGKRIWLRDAQTGKVQHTLPCPVHENEFAQSTGTLWAFSPDSSTLAVAADNGTVTLWRVR